MSLDQIYVTDVSTERPDPTTGPRRWKVRLEINGVYIEELMIHDPRPADFYKFQLNDYVRESAHVLARKFARLGKAATKEHANLGQWHDDLTAYTQSLLGILKLDTYRQTQPHAFHRGSTGCIIYIIDEDPKNDYHFHRSELSLQCLKWELLETASLGKGWPSNYTLAISRVIDVKNGHYKDLAGCSSGSDKDGGKRDVGPELTQEPLMRLQWKLNRAKTRVLLEIVRPGSLQCLRQHLGSRSKQGVHFNIVHFDLHGDEDIKKGSVPKLVFANRPGGSPKDVFSEEVKDVARLLYKERIEYVVMTTCWSAFEEAGTVHSMARQLVHSNVRGVCAVWGPTGTDCVSAFNHAFYTQLLQNHESFEAAMHGARRIIRSEPERWPGVRQYRDDFLFVYYSRDNPTKPVKHRYSISETLESCKRYISPWLNIQFFRRAGPGQQRPSLDNGGGIIPLKLLLFELEVYLQTHRIVYASDSEAHQEQMKETIQSLAKMWLRTNFIDEVHYRVIPKDDSRSITTLPKPHHKETRHTHGYFLGHRLPRAFGGTLHVISGLDDVFRPPFGSGSEERTRRTRTIKQLRKFLIELSARDYVIFLGLRVENNWMPREWEKSRPRDMGYWSHGSSVYEDALEKPNALDLLPNLAHDNIGLYY
ncbi:hypothetical protein PG996_008570 [Apiospora saccharicola]|uniref:CHAT domain-containing protein n=1 Tax=Apiospora saccharicola TaxID=335842 RepID=A0ABR1V1L0_9PEZI